MPYSGLSRGVVKKLRFLGLKNLKYLKSLNFRFLGFKKNPENFTDLKVS